MKLLKKYWILILIGAITLAAILVYVFRCKLFPALASCVEDPNKNNTPVPPDSPTPKWVKESFPLNVGMFGPKIKALQKALGFQDTNKNAPNYQDGYFGTKETKPAVIALGYSVPLSQSDYNTIISTNGGSASSNIKGAYAKYDNMIIRDINLIEKRKANKDEWLGTVTGTLASNSNYYQLDGIDYVLKSFVYLKG